VSLLADILVDRRRLRRNLFAWRSICALLLVLLIATFFGREAVFGRGLYVGLVTIEGIIVDDTVRERELYALSNDSDLAALIIYIDSPGGSTAASEALYRVMRVIAGKKPVVAVMGSVAASGGYMVSLAAERIFARESSITGSIGVVLEATNFVQLMRMAGIEHEIIRSSPLKAQPNPLEVMSPEAREVSQILVEDVHRMFKNMIAERRHLEGERLERLTDGRVFTGADALDNGLIDAIGGTVEARIWLKHTYGISDEGPEREIKVGASGDLSEWLGAFLSGNSGLVERLALDGLVSVWQPSY
jgi:protease-4